MTYPNIISSYEIRKTSKFWVPHSRSFFRCSSPFYTNILMRVWRGWKKTKELNSASRCFSLFFLSIINRFSFIQAQSVLRTVVDVVFFLVCTKFMRHFCSRFKSRTHRGFHLDFFSSFFFFAVLKAFEMCMLSWMKR